MGLCNKRSIQVDVILAELRKKEVISELEKDIVSTINIYYERPFDRDGAVKRIKENNARYPDVFIAISSMPDIVNKPFSSVSDEEVHQNLYLQIQALWAKEIASKRIE